MKFCWENSGRATCGGAGGVSELVSELVSERGEGERRRVRGGRCRGGASVAGLLAERTRVPGAVVTLGDKPSTRKPIPATLEAAIAPAIAWAYSFIKKMIPSAERGAKRESSRAERHHIGRTEWKKEGKTTGVACGGGKVPLFYIGWISSRNNVFVADPGCVRHRLR